MKVINVYQLLLAINICECGVRGRQVERWPCNHEVSRSSPGSGSQLRDFSLAHTLGASTGVVPRKQNRERLVEVVRNCFSIDIK